jgi:hypothetical protein
MAKRRFKHKHPFYNSEETVELGIVCVLVRQERTQFSELPVRRKQQAVNTSETSVSFYQTTWRNIPQDTHLHTRRRENLKSHLTPQHVQRNGF